MLASEDDFEFYPLDQKLVKEAESEVERLHSAVTSYRTASPNPERSQLSGQLGEAILARRLKGSIKTDVTITALRNSCDFLWNPTIKNDLSTAHRIEVKSYFCTSKPKLSYDASFFDSSRHQGPSHYVFCRVLKDLSGLWVLGVISHPEFWEKATFHKRGEVVPGQWVYGGPKTYWRDCWVLPIKELHPLSTIGA